jgi:hypothetical protein
MLAILAETDSKTVFHKPENMLITLQSLQTGQYTTFTLAIKISNEPIKRRADVCEAASAFYLTAFSDLDDTGVKPGRKRNRRRDRSSIGLKELRTIAPSYDMPYVTFSRTSGFLYKVETAGGQTVGRTKQNYAHLQRGQEYIVDLGNLWKVDNVRLETPVSWRELPYRILESESDSSESASLYPRSNLIHSNFSSYSQFAHKPQTVKFPKPQGIFNLPEDAQYFPQMKPETSTTYNCSSYLDYAQQPLSEGSNSSSPIDQSDDISSVSSTSSQEDSSIDDQLQYKHYPIADLAFDPVDAFNFYSLKSQYTLQDPLFDALNTQITTSTSVAYSTHDVPANMISDDSASLFQLSYDLFDDPTGFCIPSQNQSIALTEGKEFASTDVVESNDIIYAPSYPDTSFANAPVVTELNRRRNEVISTVVDSFADSQQPSVSDQSNQSAAHHVHEVNVDQYSCSSNSNECSESHDSNNAAPAVQSYELQSFFGIYCPFAEFEDESNQQDAFVPVDDGYGADEGYSADFAFELSNSSSTSSDDTAGTSAGGASASTSVVDAQCTVMEDRGGASNTSRCKEESDSHLPSHPPVFDDIVTDICLSVCHATAIPAKHWQSLFFAVWAFMEQMEVSILLSALVISALVKRHSSELTKAQVDFLNSFHICTKLRRHSYCSVEFDESYVESQSSRFLLLTC